MRGVQSKQSKKGNCAQWNHKYQEKEAVKERDAENKRKNIICKRLQTLSCLEYVQPGINSEDIPNKKY